MLTSFLRGFFFAYRNTLTPDKKTKTGAQKCVIQRVKNNGMVVCVTSSGGKGVALQSCLTWSSAMMTITRPRTISTFEILFVLTGDVSVSLIGAAAMEAMVVDRHRKLTSL